jgi:hypothetical protein
LANPADAIGAIELPVDREGRDEVVVDPLQAATLVLTALQAKR